MATRNDFKAFQKRALLLIRGIPKVMGKMVLVEISDNFRKQGYEDEQGRPQEWAPRKARGKPRGRTRQDGQRDRRYKVPKGRAILVQSGRLRRSPRIVSSTASSVTIGTDVPYAQLLQEGAQHVKPRPFITVGKSLRGNITKKVTQQITSALTR